MLQLQRILGVTHNGIDDKQLAEWPDVFERGKSQGGAASILGLLGLGGGVSIPGLGNVGGGRRAKTNMPTTPMVNPQKLDAYIFKAQQAARRAEEAAKAAQGAAELSYLREQGLADAVATTDRDWDNAARLVVGAVTQKATWEKTRKFEDFCRMADTWVKTALQEYAQAAQLKDKTRREHGMWKAKIKFQHADRLLPKVEEEAPYVQAAMKRQEEAFQAAFGHGRKLLPPRPRPITEADVVNNPEGRMLFFEPDKPPPVELMPPPPVTD